MNDVFTLSVTHANQDHDFQARLLRMGYIHQFHVDIIDRTIIFEFDEERNYRAIDNSHLSTAVDAGLIQATIDKLLELHS